MSILYMKAITRQGAMKIKNICHGLYIPKTNMSIYPNIATLRQPVICDITVMNIFFVSLRITSETPMKEVHLHPTDITCRQHI